MTITYTATITYGNGETLTRLGQTATSIAAYQHALKLPGSTIGGLTEDAKNCVSIPVNQVTEFRYTPENLTSWRWQETPVQNGHGGTTRIMIAIPEETK